MINVAVIDDEKKSVSELLDCLSRFENENGKKFKINVYSGGKEFLQDADSSFDIVFLDIDMPEMNGFQIANQLRKNNDDVIIVFITNLLRYAIKGYKYDAVDYVIKPLKYSSFQKTLNKLVSIYENNKDKKNIGLNTLDGITIVAVDDIKYVEINGHRIIYHMTEGQLLGYGTMKKVEEELPRDTFFRCNSCYLVNLKHVKQVKGLELTVGEDVLVISHPRKKNFMEALHNYYGKLI